MKPIKKGKLRNIDKFKNTLLKQLIKTYSEERTMTTKFHFLNTTIHNIIEEKYTRENLPGSNIQKIKKAK